MATRKILNIGLSSMHLWVFKDGDMTTKHRAISDANCDVIIPTESKQTGVGTQFEGEEHRWKPEDYVDYSDKHVVKIRLGWDGTDDDDKYWGKLKLRPSDCPMGQIKESNEQKV